jgi:DMSO/TMAO reductase YedYZ molybdopterin-dependent catalytic subunit
MTKNNIKPVKLMRYLYLAGLTVLGLFTIIATGGGVKENTAPDLGAGEIREHEGQALSSINDFRENSILGPQYVNREEYELKVTGLVENPTAYTYDDVINTFDHYKKVATLHCVEGWSVKLLWEGMLVRDLIEEAGPLSSARVIIFHGYDGDTTSFPIEYILNNDIIMAYKMNDITIPPQRGFPFQLVAEDKWGYKWAKWITGIELSDDENYTGYWESRGYSNSGALYECTPGLISAQPAGHTARTDCCACHSVSAN